MGKIKTGLCLLCALCFWCSAFGQPVLTDYPVLEKTTDLRHKLISVAESQLFVREETGNNDGPQIRKYLRSVGLPEGYPYCAAGMAWCHNELNIPNPESAWSPDWFNTNVVYRRGSPSITVFESRPGQVFGLWYESRKRIAHVGMITGETKFHYLTIEFNTNGAGSNEGQGNHRLIRKKENIHVVSDYVGFAEIREAMKSSKHR